MEDAEFGLITSIFTIGGLISSLLANRITDPYGRRPAVQINAILVALGSAIAATASSVFALSVARFLIGLAAGLALCVAPAFLSEIAPSKVRDAVGVLNQLAVVFGILFTQFLGFAFAKPGSWRINAVMYYSTGILSSALPDAAAYVSLGVAVINVIMTFPPIFVIERYGQRRLLMYSIAGSVLSVVLLAMSLNYNVNTASAVGTLLFVR
ncbi:hypothetical protein FRC17_002901 [Serendipita sp. 399]|nr:hypothetical protein FRC17_002901 [Serendipita sp. 399]